MTFQNQHHIEYEIRALAREIDRLRTEIHDIETNRSRNSDSIFHNPTLLTMLSLVGAILTGVWQLHAGRELEREKLQSTLIQEASKSGDSKTTLRNLQFLAKAGLIKDENNQIKNLQLDDVPSFTTKALTPDEMKSSFGDPKLQKTNDSMSFSKPDEKWVSENIVSTKLTQLIGIKGFPESGEIKFHKLAAPHLQAAINEIAEKGLLSRIESFDGAWSPRFIRGSANTTSPHAFGIALDINAQFNPFGKIPPKTGEKGSVTDLIPIFEKHGFYWGGNFFRPDGMHFQYGIKSSEVKITHKEQ